MYQNVQANPATVIAVSDLREFCKTKCVEQSSLFGEFDVSYHKHFIAILQNSGKQVLL